MTDKLFSASNKLNHYGITIGDIDLIKETIISVEIAYINSSPIITGTIIIDDLYDMNLQLEWDQTAIVIKYLDIFETQVQHEFVILNITEKYDDKNDKFFIIEVQDKFSYTLQHSFLSKSFSTNIISCISSYMTQLELTNTQDFTTLDIKENFTIPQHINNLDAFQIELNKKGFAFYQTKTAVVIKSISDLKPSELTYNGLYMNETDNQLYMNRIIEMRNIFNNRRNVPDKTKALGYDFLTKSITTLESNDITDYVLNTDTTNPQDTFGIKNLYQHHTDYAQNTKEMKDQFLSRADIQIVVNGYNKNDVNQIFELKLKGNKSTADGQSKGNQIINGKYISYGVIDKIVVDSLVQKINLSRVDLTKWA